MEVSKSISLWAVVPSLWLFLLPALIGWAFIKIVYNIYFHPLSKFPGPTAAKATDWWQTYHELVKKDNMLDLYARLHEQYGDIVRVAPNELAFLQPEAYNEIYNQKWDKEYELYKAMGEDHASFGMLSTAEARQRKNVLHPLFSRRAIINVQPLIRETMDHMAEVLIKNNENGKSADLQNAFRCYALDNITSFTFAKSYHALDEPNFASPISKAMDHQLPPFFLLKNFSLFRKLIFAMPPWLASKVSPKTAGFSKLQMSLQTLVKDVLTNPEILKETNQPTVFERLLDPEAHKGGGASIPGFKALCQEAQVQIFAGTTTVADTLMTGHFHILSQPELYRKLQAEIRTVWPDINSPPPYEVLESLPLLTATIKESLRKFPGSTNQLLRVVGSSGSGTTISGAFIPAGTVVGMSNPSVHKNCRIFPDPHRFLPERWLGEKARGLDQFLVAFSKGPRGCLGLNLAWCELYVCFATMLRRFEMVLDETREEDVDMWLPFSLPWYYGRHLKVCCCPVED